MGHFLLLPVGSGGDVQPFVGIGRALIARGHEVTMLSDEPYRAMIEAAGLKLVPIGTAADHERVHRNPDLWHPIRGLRLVFRELASGMRGAYDRIGAAYRPGESVLAIHPLAVHGRLFAEVHDAPCASVLLQPSVLRSDHALPATPDGRDLSGWPRWSKRMMFWLADRFVIDRHIAPELNAWRRELGLAPVRRLFDRWIYSPRLILALFPRWFAEPQPDWPSQLEMTTFPRFDDAARRPLGEDVAAWIESGEPPLAFTAGTANVQARAFFAVAVAAALRLGRRALLLTGDRAQIPRALPDGVRHIAYAPFSQLFRRCAAIIHHGGVGTSAQSLAAGVPQLLMPMAFDQPDNALRLRRLGVARFLRPRRFRAPAVADELTALLASEATATACRRWRDALAAEDPLAATCEHLESLLDASSRRAL